LLPAGDTAAQAPMRVQIENVQVGFRPYAHDEFGGRFKAGLWAPVYVSFSHAPDGSVLLRTGKDGLGRGELLVETADSDDVENIYRVPLALAPGDRRPVLTYTRAAVGHPDIKVGVAAGGQTFATEPRSFAGMELGEHLYLALGARLGHFQDALIALAPGKEKEAGNSSPRHAAYETDVQRLPAEWFGYDAVDLMILTTDNNVFLDGLRSDRARLIAVADWVRRGGKLVVSVAWRNQDKVHALLRSEAWQPPLPDILPANGQEEIKQLFGIQSWAEKAREKPFPAPGQEPVRVARLNPGKDAEVLVGEPRGQAVIVRAPYGLGSVTVVAFDLDKGPFSVWSGRVEFWMALLEKLAPRVAVAAEVQGINNPVFMDTASDVATTLQRELDKFDVAVISFGWVALFILLYILVVGPLDYLILKKVFKRLEWTWITFPTVVLLVSAVAYFTAYALKGNDLKINKIDLIDLDLRSDLDAEQHTRRAYAYGTSWFTILSPRIQNYTIGIAPEGRAANAGGKDDAEALGALVTWLGRPEGGGMGGMGRQRSQGLFRRAYDYAPDATGLLGVPIPVWATKSFTASWKVPLARLPFHADLHYRPAEPEQFSGTIRNNFPVHLTDGWIFYGNEWYPLDPEEPRKDPGDRMQHWKVASEPNRGRKTDAWVTSREQAPQPRGLDLHGQSFQDSTFVVKTLLFQQSSDSSGQERNHSLRRLDQSWRLSSQRWQRPGLTREAILFARLPRTTGQSPEDNRAALGADLWLGELPGQGRTRPALPGSLIQDTYLRVYLPVTPAQP